MVACIDKRPTARRLISGKSKAAQCHYSEGNVRLSAPSVVPKCEIAAS
ncbi:unnamed protein product [Soboliphyme baturini]|uniref:Uncharacterized protein n=1 Tax=Soboliphyme baturini TaxID=241478 RepID=A0A183JAN1_9BILA|nr:unnamed protein product [Soboliphyme baturini]